MKTPKLEDVKKTYQKFSMLAGIQNLNPEKQPDKGANFT